MLTDKKNISEDFHYFLEDVGSLCLKISTGVCHLAQKEKIENCAIALNLDRSEDCIHLVSLREILRQIVKASHKLDTVITDLLLIHTAPLELGRSGK